MLESDMWLNTGQRTNSWASATVVTWTRHNVTFYVHCLSRYSWKSRRPADLTTQGFPLFTSSQPGKYRTVSKIRPWLLYSTSFTIYNSLIAPRLRNTHTITDCRLLCAVPQSRKVPLGFVMSDRPSARTYLRLSMVTFPWNFTWEALMKIGPENPSSVEIGRKYRALYI